MLFALFQDPTSKLLNGRDDELMIVARILEKQLNEQVCPSWDRALCEVVYTTAEDWQKNTPHAFPLDLIDTPDVDGALGYHVRDGAKIFIKPSLDMGSDILSGPYAISGVAAHECFEALGDLTVNLWAQVNNSIITAIELADAVEHDPVSVSLDDGTTAMGSNFLFPSWFDPSDMEGPYDWATYKDPARANALLKPFTMTPGGYMIVETTVAGSEQQVLAKTVADVMAKTGAYDVTSVRLNERVVRHHLFGSAYPTWKKDLKVKHGRRARALKAA